MDATVATGAAGRFIWNWVMNIQQTNEELSVTRKSGVDRDDKDRIITA